MSDGRAIVDTPRYARFTEILKEIAARRGTVVEIAGNDDVLVTAIDSGAAPLNLPDGATLLASVTRDGFGDRRLLLDVKVPALARVITSLRDGPVRLEHVHDY